METLQTRGIRPSRPYNLRSPWGNNRIPSTEALTGREIALERDDGATVTLAFTSDTVTWRDGADEPEQQAAYDAVAARDGVYFIDFLHANSDLLTSIILNERTNGAVLIRHTIVRDDGRADLQQDLYPCLVAGTDGEPPTLSGDLVGKRAYAEYADGHAVEHVYFNPRRIVWQGLGRFDYSGSECDHATMWKIDDQLYLLTWVEEWQAVGAALLLDYSALRNVGVLYGLDDSGFVHTLCGARLQLLADLSYPPGYLPGGMNGEAI
ncbi:MAG TPA: MoaF N-terminal domain-containing protein [Solirubrobacteraceae bacterium]|jgi:hypothetical protein|nr:MoaF N-terminal domain-containing protein [Solirubrobacteraceae bacterium]